MTDEEDKVLGEERHRRPGREGEGEGSEGEGEGSEGEGEGGAPVTTGDLQEVGATRPEEYRRRRHVDGEPPVHEDPGGQVSG